MHSDPLDNTMTLAQFKGMLGYAPSPEQEVREYRIVATMSEAQLDGLIAYMSDHAIHGVVRPTGGAS